MNGSHLRGVGPVLGTIIFLTGVAIVAAGYWRLTDVRRPGASIRNTADAQHAVLANSRGPRQGPDGPPGPPPGVDTSQAPGKPGVQNGPPPGDPPPGPPPGGYGTPPPGGFGNPPPGGAPNGGPPPGGPGGPPPGHGGPYKLTAVLTLGNGASKTLTGRTITSQAKDVSAVYVSGGAALNLVQPTITTRGNTSSDDNSSFHGLNAGVLAGEHGKIKITGGSISTSGTGANGLFAAGEGSSASMTGGTIAAAGPGAHGVMATKGGSITLDGVAITTAQERGAPVATDRGGGTIIMRGGSTRSSGRGSPAIYSTGNITVTGATMLSTGAEAAVIEGANSITLHNCSLTGRKFHGVMIYQSFSGDAEGSRGVFTMNGGSLTATTGSLFLVTNTHGIITLSQVKLTAPSGVLIQASTERWGVAGRNGGTVELTADRQELKGDLIADSISRISATLRNASVLTGKVKRAALTLDGSSRWLVTGDSDLTGLSVAGGDPAQARQRIVGNGHTVTYDRSLPGNAWLSGKSYPLSGGGALQPASK